MFEAIKELQKAGYKLGATSEIPGEVSHRGDILDIFPVNMASPVRIEFFGNAIESIRLYDPSTQRSIKNIKSVSAGPSSEFLSLSSLSESDLKAILEKVNTNGLKADFKHSFERHLQLLSQRNEPEFAQVYLPLFNKSSIFSYLSGNTLVIHDEPYLISEHAEFLDREAETLKDYKLKQKELPEGLPSPYFFMEN